MEKYAQGRGERNRGVARPCPADGLKVRGEARVIGLDEVGRRRVLAVKKVEVLEVLRFFESCRHRKINRVLRVRPSRFFLRVVSGLVWVSVCCSCLFLCLLRRRERRRERERDRGHKHTAAAAGRGRRRRTRSGHGANSGPTHRRVAAGHLVPRGAAEGGRHRVAPARSRGRVCFRYRTICLGDDVLLHLWPRASRGVPWPFCWTSSPKSPRCCRDGGFRGRRRGAAPRVFNRSRHDALRGCHPESRHRESRQQASSWQKQYYCKGQ